MISVLTAVLQWIGTLSGVVVALWVLFLASILGLFEEFTGDLIIRNVHKLIDILPWYVTMFLLMLFFILWWIVIFPPAGFLFKLLFSFS